MIGEIIVSKEKVFKILNIIKKVLCGLLIGILVIFVMLVLIARINGDIPSFFGYTIYRVSTGSMEPELSVGDVILSKSVEDPSELKIGDVITFDGTGDLQGMMITHKVIKEPYINDDGVEMLQTQGVANEVPDDEIRSDSVVSIMVCEISFLQYIYSFFLSPWGLLIFIGLLILIFMKEIINIVKILTGTYKDPDEEETDINEIIDRLQAEKIEQLKSEAEANANISNEDYLETESSDE